MVVTLNSRLESNTEEENVPEYPNLALCILSRLAARLWCRVHGFRDFTFSIEEQLLRRNVNRFREGLVLKAHRLCVPLNSRLDSNKEEEGSGVRDGVWGLWF